VPKLLSRATVIAILRAELRSAGDSPLLKDGVAENQLLAMELDGFFASDENLSALIKGIKTAVEAQGGKLLLGKAEIRAAVTFGDLLTTVRSQLVAD